MQLALHSAKFVNYLDFNPCSQQDVTLHSFADWPAENGLCTAILILVHAGNESQEYDSG